MCYLDLLNQIQFKTYLLRASLCDYSISYVLVSGTITITGTEADDATKNRMKEKK